MSSTEVPPGADYRGPSGIARESTWLTSEDLDHTKETEVTIESVVLRRNLTFQGGRPKSVALSLKFAGKQRELLLNATNRKTLGALFGTNECAEWFAKRIILIVEQGVRRPDGTRGPAIRIKPTRLDPLPPVAAGGAS